MFDERKQPKSESKQVTIGTKDAEVVIACSSYQARYIAGAFSWGLGVIDLASKSRFVCEIAHKDVAAVGILGDAVVTVSSSNVKRWDRSCLSQESPAKPAQEMSFENYHCDPIVDSTRFRTIGKRGQPQQIYDGSRYTKLNIFPEKELLIVKNELNSQILFIDLAQEKSVMIGPTTFTIIDIAFVEPNFLALSYQNKIALFDISQIDISNKASLEDFFQQKKVMEFEIPEFKGNFHVAPGGHVWAIVHDFHFTICKFDYQKKELTKINKLIENIFLQWPRPVFAGQKFYFTSKVTSSAAPELKSYNLKDGVVSIVKKPDYNDPMQAVFSTILGVGVKCIHDSFIEFIPEKFQPVKSLKLVWQEKISLFTNLPMDPSSVIADYLLTPGFDMEAPEQLPLPEEILHIVARLQEFRKDFPDETKIGQELLTFMNSFLFQPQEIFDQRIKACPTLTKLYNDNGIKGFFTLSRAEKKLAKYLDELAVRNKKPLLYLEEFKNVKP